MVSSFVFGLALLGAGQFSFYSQGPYDPAVPKPDAILGYELGTKHTVYRDQEQVVLAIAAAAKSRVREIDYGKSTEGRTLRVFAISSSENIAKLDSIRDSIGKLASGDADKSVEESTPVVVWVNECIHGDETASFESAMALIYNLAASQSKRVDEMLDQAVVIVNPVYNPDGHERYVVAYNSLPGGVSGQGAYDRTVPSAFFGRANHYRFDMNRDRIALSQAESRQEVAEFLKWNPQVYVDQHGQVETYFFPPVQQSVNINVGRDRYNHWTDVFGRATASAFDTNGWTYFVRDSFDFYNACYLDSFTTLSGAIGMTHETDGGRILTREREDGTLLTVREGAEKHFTSAMAVIESAGQHRQELLASYAGFKHDSATGKSAGKFQRVVVSGDGRALKRFQAHLMRAGIQSSLVVKSWKQGGVHDYWSDWKGSREFAAGSVVVDLAQPMGALAKALLEPGSDFEPDFVKRQKDLALAEKEKRPDPEIDSYEFYDSTAWSLPLAYGLEAWWCESAPKVETGVVLDDPKGFESSPVGYLLRYSDREDVLAVADALTAGLHVSMNTHEIKAGGQTIPVGSFMFLRARNGEDLDARLRDLAEKRPVQFEPLKTSYPDEGRQGPGSESVMQLKKPKVGLVFGDNGNLQMGALWYLMEQEFRMPFESLSSGALRGDLSGYTCLVVPSLGSVPTDGKLRDWLQSGGTLVCLSGLDRATGQDGYLSLKTRKSDVPLPGSIFKAELDPFSVLGYGYPHDGVKPISVAVPVDGNQFALPEEGGSAVQFSKDEKVKKVLSGWEWDSTEKDLAGTAWLADSGVGRGRVVVFSSDPTDRAQWPGLYKMLLNAIYLTP